ncbi:dienelactone hydrolase family protein [Ascidiimonas aurantiaca]|uniref:dienelactone hydrolase family protein n=1 Tax=Ascidiimonas aurantiaca TaxID=1685432 RepID=UPI0030ECCB19
MKHVTHIFFLCILLFNITGCKQDKKETAQPEGTVLKEESKIKGEEVTYKTDSISMKGYIAYDENLQGKRPGVIVIHEWWGHNDYVRERADMLAKLGYTAIAVDMYGDGKQATHPQDAGKFASSVMGNLPVAKARFDAAMQMLQAHSSVDPGQIAAIGYCFGGSVALTMANTGRDLDAVAAFHSGVQLPVMPNDKLKARVLVCNGADDPFVPKEAIATFKRQMDSIGAQYTYIAYEGAVHAFTSKAADSLGKKFNLPLAYQKEADEKSWQELVTMLENVFE